MFAGHFGLASAVRPAVKTVPLWALMLSTQLLDVLFVPLYLLGIEKLEPIEGGGYGKQIIYADFTHSLLGAIIISSVAWYFAKNRWGRKGGIVIGGMVFSHWVLDFFVHRADMPILPANFGNFPRLGFGIWAIPNLSIFLEGLLVITGGYLYSKFILENSPPKNRAKALFASLLLSFLLASSLITSVYGLG